MVLSEAEQNPTENDQQRESRTMRAAVVTGPGEVRIDSVPLPQPGPGQVRDLRTYF